MNLIDWSRIPQFNINVGKLSAPSDILAIMKQNRVRKYIYRIKYKGILIKFGMSADNSKNFGERIYRQIAHCISWGPLRNRGACGSDWLIIEQDFKTQYGFDIDHNDISITIYNLSNYPFKTISPWDEIIAIENYLIEKYVNIVGEKPIGNINDEAHIKRRPKILTTTWDSCFK